MAGGILKKDLLRTGRYMFVLIAVINNEELLDKLVDGWLDAGVTGATILESTDLLHLVNHHVSVFAGFRSLSNGGIPHNKTIFTAIEDQKVLDQAVACLKSLCRSTKKPSQGVYCVVPLADFGRLGVELDPDRRRRHLEKKVGRRLKKQTDSPPH